MIEEVVRGRFLLYCDNCGNFGYGMSDNFQDVVDYKKDTGNGWRTVKDQDGDWYDLCPECSTPDELRNETGPTDLALRALEDL
jgi:hypothetical protein